METNYQGKTRKEQNSQGVGVEECGIGNFESFKSIQMTITTYLQYEEIITDFNEKLWHTFLEQVVITDNKTAIFTFKKWAGNRIMISCPLFLLFTDE